MDLSSNHKVLKQQWQILFWNSTTGWKNKYTTLDMSGLPFSAIKNTHILAGFILNVNMK